MSVSPLHREWPWLVAGVAVAVVWFVFNRSLPPLFRGDVCCDASHYLIIAEEIAGARTVQPGMTAGTDPVSHPLGGGETLNSLTRFVTLAFTYAGYVPPGLPLFLGITHGVAGITGLDAWFSPLSVSLGIELLLLLGAAWFFYRSVGRLMTSPLHPVALLLLLAHPGLVSHVAIPVADAFATVFMMIGIGSLCRAMRIMKDPPSSASVYDAVAGESGIGNRMMWGACAGIGLALAVYTRTQHLPAAAICLLAWFGIALVRVIRSRHHPVRRAALRSLLVSLVALSGFGLTIFPRVFACTRATGAVCYSLPADRRVVVANLSGGLTGARTYTVLAPGFAKLVTLTDPQLLALSRECPIGPVSPVMDMALCLIRHPARAVVYEIKKTIGLFDNFHLNSYATYVTPLGVVLWNRLFSMIVFAGFFALSVFFISFVRHGRLPPESLAIPLFAVTFAGYTNLLMMESRFGLALVPFGITGAVLVFMHVRRRHRHSLAVALFTGVLCAIFVLQTSIWDARDPLPRMSVSEALRPGGPAPAIVPPLLNMN